MNHMRAGNWPALRSAGTKRPHSDNDPKLAFMLAQHATARLQFDVQTLEASAANARDPEFARSEAQIAMDQIAALKARIAPFQHGTADEVRFQAQEILAALDGVNEQFEGLVRSAGAPVSRNAFDIAARLMGRRH